MLAPGLIRHAPTHYNGLLFVGDEPNSERGLSFRERGFAFIPLRQAHLEFFAFVFDDRAAPKLEDVVGCAMVDDRYLPLGFAMVHLEPAPNGAPGVIPYLYAYFGPWLRIYAKDILRHMHLVADGLRRRGLRTILADAARDISGADTLLKWLRAEPTGRETSIGPQYRIDLTKSPI